MKKIVILFTYIVASLSAFPQANVYHKFPTADAIWRESSGGYQSMNCRDYQYIVMGDTMIGSLVYHKLQLSGVQYAEDQWGNCTSTIVSYYNYYEGEYREDILAKRIYFHSQYYPSDTLLYDFNLNLGDSLSPSLTNNQSYSQNMVTSVDSVLVGYEYRKRFGISSGASADYVYLIEGLGSTFGLFGFLAPPFEFGSSLVCFKQNGITLYPDTSSTCDLLTGIKNKRITDEAFTIFPNPFHESFEIQIPLTSDKVDFILYDLLSRPIYTTSEINNKRIKVSPVSPAPGIYYYRLMSENNVIASGKIISR